MKDRTMLELIRDQLQSKATRAIVQALEGDAEIVRTNYGVIVNGVFITKNDINTKPSILLTLDNAPEIDALFEPSKEQLQKRVFELTEELRKTNEQLNQMKQ